MSGIPYAFLVQAVCDQFGVTEVDLRLRTRDLLRTDARKVAVRILVDAGCGVTQAGRILHRDHSTIIHAAKAPLDRGNSEVLLDAQRAAARRWELELAHRSKGWNERRAAARRP